MTSTGRPGPTPQPFPDSRVEHRCWSNLSAGCRRLARNLSSRNSTVRLRRDHYPANGGPLSFRRLCDTDHCGDERKNPVDKKLSSPNLCVLRFCNRGRDATRRSRNYSIAGGWFSRNTASLHRSRITCRANDWLGRTHHYSSTQTSSPNSRSPLQLFGDCAGESVRL